MIKKQPTKPVNFLKEGDAKSFTRWTEPEVDGVAVNADEIDRRKREQGILPEAEELVEEELPKPPTSEELQAIRDAAYEEGFSEGKVAAEQQVLTNNQKKVKEFELLLQAFIAPLNAFDDVAEFQLAKLATLIAKQIIRRELQIDPNHVIAVVRESVQLLPSHNQDVVVSLHPEDARLLFDNFHLSHEEGARWQIKEDPSLTRGDCRIVAGNSSIHADLETRIAKISSKILGSQRSEGGDDDNH